MNKNSVVTLKLDVDAKGKLLSTRVLSEEPRGYNMGTFWKEVLSRTKFIPGFRRGKACASSFEMTCSTEIERFGYGSRSGD